MKTYTLAILFFTVVNYAYAAKTPSIEEMWQIIQQQQTTIEKLKAQIQGNSQNVEQQSQVLEIISDNMDESTNQSQSKYKFGGYGELHYGNTDNGNSVDFHRFVLFNGYDFTDNTRFYSELELEHAFSGNGKPGEVELEQAFIEHRFNDTRKMTAGVSLLPVGIINETHEPNTFYGVERNNVEKNIIPATWWAAGIGYSQEVNDSLGFDLYLGDGLNVPVTGSKAFLIRSGRQKVAKATANKGSLTGRVRLNLLNNLQLNATLMYQQDITQGALGVDATLLETNLRYTINNFTLKALYARWDINEEVEQLSLGRSKQNGFYIEPSYRFGKQNQFGVFGRYSNWDNNAGDDNNKTDITQLDLGFNFWLTPQVVFKADYQDQSGAKDEDGFHLGMGYSF